MESTLNETNLMQNRRVTENVSTENKNADTKMYCDRQYTIQESEKIKRSYKFEEQKEEEEHRKCIRIKNMHEEFLYAQFRQYYLENRRNADDLRRLRSELASVLEFDFCGSNSETTPPMFTGTRANFSHTPLAYSSTNVFHRRENELANNANFHNRLNNIMEAIRRHTAWLWEHIHRLVLSIWVLIIIPFVNSIIELIVGNPIIALFIVMEIYRADDTLPFMFKLALVAFVWNNFIRHHQFLQLAIVPAEQAQTLSAGVTQLYSFTGRLINYTRFAHANGSVSWYVKATYIIVKCVETFLASIVPMYDVRRLETELSADEIVRGRGARWRR